jgi:hypothetical protein
LTMGAKEVASVAPMLEVVTAAGVDNSMVGCSSCAAKLVAGAQLAAAGRIRLSLSVEPWNHCE